jgi:hypothetical protein
MRFLEVKRRRFRTALHGNAYGFRGVVVLSPSASVGKPCVPLDRRDLHSRYTRIPTAKPVRIRTKIFPGSMNTLL